MPETNYTHLITLRPVDIFFFGSERTFGNDELVNYRAVTRNYPQQTTLLGVLRYLGYFANGIGKDKIGDSFVADSFIRASNYGFINSISPLFFQQESDSGTTIDYGFAPYLSMALTKNPPRINQLKAEIWTGSGNDWIPLPELQDYQAKDNYQESLLSKDGKPILLEDVVKTSERIGITKQLADEEKTDGFYKQTVGQLAPGFTFAYLADLNLEAGSIPEQQIIQVGAEKALFSVTCTDIKGPKTYSERIPASLYEKCKLDKHYTAILLSDAYVERLGFEQLAFAAAGAVDFRHLHTPAGVSNWGRLARKGGNGWNKDTVLHQSAKFNLLGRGSLLFAKTEKELNDLLVQPRWQNIGYNHFHLLPTPQ